MTARPARPSARTGPRLAALGLAAALALTACGTAVRSGAAAVIGDDRITTDELAGIVDAGIAAPGAAEQLGGDRPAYQRRVLEQLIQGDLVARTAERLGVTVTQGQVDAEYASIEEQVGGAEALPQQAAAAGLSLKAVRDLARTRALSQAVGDRLTQDVEVPEQALRAAYEQSIDTYDRVRTRQIAVPTLADAQALLPEARGLDDPAFAELARTRSTDESTKEQGGDLGLQPRSAFEQNDLAAYGAAAFAAQPGETFAVEGGGGGGAYVVRVVERRTVPFEQAVPELRRQVLGQQRDDALSAALRETASNTDISINPRFGSWDAETLAVGAPSEGVDRGVSAPPQAEEPAS